MSEQRNKQLDGWRAFAVLGVMWLHWAPSGWRGPIPFEIGLFFFLTLTGYLITRNLLNQEASERVGRWWWVAGYGRFLQKRAKRIVVPCYAAMVLAMIFRAPDLLAHPWWYFFHLSNWHMAFLEGWPCGTAHYWTLAIQVQFYLLWPLVIWWCPKTWRVGLMVVLVSATPVMRYVVESHFPEVKHSQVLTMCALDYFGLGAWFALMVDAGNAWVLRRLTTVAWWAFGGYAIVYAFNEAGAPLPVLKYVQQTLLALAIIGLIHQSQLGYRGKLAWVLEHPLTQHISRLSYGLYLTHTIVPMMVGYGLGFLWHPDWVEVLLPVRLLVFSVVAWGIAYGFWYGFEKSKPRKSEENR